MGLGIHGDILIIDILLTGWLTEVHQFQLGPESSVIDTCSLIDYFHLSRLQRGKGGNPVPSLEKAISLFRLTSCFTLADGWLPPGRSGVVTAEGWPRSHG